MRLTLQYLYSRNSMNPSSKLGPRLNSIYDLIVQAQQEKPYQYIWDCCCDHGYLGIKILANELCVKVVFVDQLPHLIEQLNKKIAPFDIGRHELITADAGDLTFNANVHHLVILAGVGGDSSVDIVQRIKKNHPTELIDFIFCPSSSKQTLRKYLAKNKFSLLDEKLVYDNKRYYEILFVKGTPEESGCSEVLIDCGLWEDENPDHQRYLKKINTPRVSKKPKRSKTR